MTIARLPHISVTNENQHRRRYNELADAVSSNFFYNGVTESGTSPGTANTQFAITHNLGRIPTGYVLLAANPAGTLYQTATSGTPWTTTQIFVKATIASMSYTVYIS